MIVLLVVLLVLSGCNITAEDTIRLCKASSNCSVQVEDASGNVIEEYIDYSYTCNMDRFVPCQTSMDCYPYSCYDHDSNPGTSKICYALTQGNQPLGSCSNNFGYNKTKVDSFGMYCPTCDETDHASPGSWQTDWGSGSFDYLSYIKDAADAWTLKKVTWPSGSTTVWHYDVDQWYTSRGDEASPVNPISKNYYLQLRNDGDGTNACSLISGSNYGGGLRVSSQVDCNGMGDCIPTYYSYEMYDPEMGCVRSSGAIDIVPFSKSIREEEDLRRPSHTGGEQTSGGVLYNRVVKRVGDDNGYQVYYFTTTDSTPENTDGAIDTPAEDYFPMDTPRDYNLLASSAAISALWKRGLEYKVETYSDEILSGKERLLAETNRIYSTDENLKWFFGGMKLLGKNPLFRDDPDEPLIFSAYDANSYFSGVASGTMNIDEINNIYYTTYGYNNLPDGNYKVQILNRGTDAKTGSPNHITEVISDGNQVYYKTDRITRVYETDSSIESAHMFSLIDTHRIYDGWDDIGETESYLVMEYSDFGSGEGYCMGRLRNNQCSEITDANDIINVNACGWDGSQGTGEIVSCSSHGKSACQAIKKYNLGCFWVGNRIFLSSTKSWLDADFDEVVDNNELHIVASVNSYDDYGNPLETQDSSGNNVFIRYNSKELPSHGWNQEYGSDGNPAWVKKYYDNGLLANITDENGKTINYYYDSHLRLEKVVDEGDSYYSPSREYVYHDYESSNNPNWQLTKTKISSGVYSEVKEFTDGWGKVVQTQRKKEGSTWIVAIVEYDKVGRKYREYQPFESSTSGNYYTGSAGTSFTEYQYYPDPLNKVKKKILPNGADIQYLYGSYNGLPTITVKDENDQVKRFVYDTSGKIIRVEMNSTSGLMITGFEV